MNTRDASSESTRPAIVRTVVIGLVGVVAVASIVSAVLGFWTVRNATDSDRFEERVETVLRREDVSDALAGRIVEELAQSLDLGAAVTEAVPDVLDPVANMLLAGVRSGVEDRLGESLRSDRLVETVGAAAGQAHATTVRVIEGDGVVDGVAVVDGEVRINLLPVVLAGLEQFQEFGLLADVELPEFDRNGDPDQQREELSDALDRPLADDFGELVVYSSDSLDRTGDAVARAVDLFAFAKRALWALAAVGVVLAAVSIWMSVNRLRSAAFIVGGIVLSALAMRWATSVVSHRIPDAVEEAGARGALAELANGFESSLNQTMLVVSLLALAALAAAWWISSNFPRPETATSNPVPDAPEASG